MIWEADFQAGPQFGLNKILFYSYYWLFIDYFHWQGSGLGRWHDCVVEQQVSALLSANSQDGALRVGRVFLSPVSPWAPKACLNIRVGRSSGPGKREAWPVFSNVKLRGILSRSVSYSPMRQRRGCVSSLSKVNKGAVPKSHLGHTGQVWFFAASPFLEHTESGDFLTIPAFLKYRD